MFFNDYHVSGTDICHNHLVSSKLYLFTNIYICPFGSLVIGLVKVFYLGKIILLIVCVMSKYTNANITLMIIKLCCNDACGDELC